MAWQWVDLLLLATICEGTRNVINKKHVSLNLVKCLENGFLGPSEQWCNSNHRAIVEGLLYSETPQWRPIKMVAFHEEKHKHGL